MTSDSDGAPGVQPKLSSTKVRQTLSNLCFCHTKLKLLYQIDSDAALLPFVIHQLGLTREWNGISTRPYKPPPPPLISPLVIGLSACKQKQYI